MTRVQRWSRSTALLLVVAPATFAADVWIDVEPSRPEPGEPVSLRVLEGRAASARPVVFDPDRVTRFQHVWTSGRVHLQGTSGRPAGARLDPPQPGVHLAAFSRREPGVEHHAKALIVVGTARRDDPIRWSELGQRLEIVPQTDPVAVLHREGGLQIQLLFEREPLAATIVTATRRSGGEPQSVVTDEIGIGSFRLDTPGQWIVRAGHLAPCAECRDGSKQRVVATLTLAVE